MIPTGRGGPAPYGAGPYGPAGFGYPPPDPQTRADDLPANGKRHWWSLAPVPTFSQTISAKRAYIEAIGVYLIFFGPSIVAAAGSLANYNEPNPEGWWITGPNAFQEIVQAVLAVLVVVVMAERRGRRPRDVGLVVKAAKGGPGAHQAIRMAAWAAFAFLVGSLVTSALATGNYPYGHNSLANTLLEISSSANAGVMEEIVVLAFIVTTLEQAKRRRGEILVVALICRAGYHIYYGPGVVGILVWAAVFIWLFWRFRSVVPMIITHICWDSLVFLSQLSNAFDVVLELGVVVLMITGGVLWLVDRTGRVPVGGYHTAGAPGSWSRGPGGRPPSGAPWAGQPGPAPGWVPPRPPVYPGAAPGYPGAGPGYQGATPDEPPPPAVSPPPAGRPPAEPPSWGPRHDGAPERAPSGWGPPADGDGTSRRG